MAGTETVQTEVGESACNKTLAAYLRGQLRTMPNAAGLFDTGFADQTISAEEPELGLFISKVNCRA
jgi:hypothetical protein